MFSVCSPLWGYSISIPWYFHWFHVLSGGYWARSRLESTPSWDGVPPRQVRMTGTPGWRTPPFLGWCSPHDRTREGVLATRRVACLLRSRRRTFLFLWFSDFCAAGYTKIGNSCVQCDKGSAKSNTGDHACALCSKGTFSDARGLSQCHLCPIGTFANETGQTSCRDCPAGLSSSADRSGCGEWKLLFLKSCF